MAVCGGDGTLTVCRGHIGCAFGRVSGRDATLFIDLLASRWEMALLLCSGMICSVGDFL